jgi:hypothetical protein
MEPRQVLVRVIAMKVVMALQVLDATLLISDPGEVEFSSSFVGYTHTLNKLYKFTKRGHLVRFTHGHALIEPNNCQRLLTTRERVA